MLECRHLSAAYGTIQALASVDLVVRSQTLTVLLGANGAGKSTLVKVVAGLVPASSGEVVWQGRELSGTPEARARQGLAVVPEGRQLWPRLTVYEHLLVGAYRHLPWRDRMLRRASPAVQGEIARVTALFPALRGYFPRSAETLSGGEQQMLALARALMARPALLLLDEPSVGLAPRVVSGLFRALRGLVQSGLTVLLAEQNARAALAYADEAYVLERGRITLAGSAAELRQAEVLGAAYLGGGGTQLG